MLIKRTALFTPFFIGLLMELGGFQELTCYNNVKSITTLNRISDGVRTKEITLLL